MKKLLYLIPVLLFTAACAEDVKEEEAFGNISGIVYDKSVGEPIPVAQVKLSPGGNSTVTGTDGAFAFNDIEAGSYTISVTKKGYNDGSNTVTVVAGKKAECNLLMERIPAYVTADKDSLDFGENATASKLSFNIVNSSYETLSWHIEYDKSSSSFIAEVSPESGTTPYGKTSVIVVTIDREKLNAGKNETTLVVVSDNGDGSSEVKLIAIGEEKSLATLNVLPVTLQSSSSVILNGEITFPGVPAYEERGFVYSTSKEYLDGDEPSDAVERVSVTVTDEKKFSYLLKGLKIDDLYYVRAYAKNKIGTAYSTNIEPFKTEAKLPEVQIDEVDDIDATGKTAVVKGSVTDIGDPAYFERGFVYCEGHGTPALKEDDKDTNSKSVFEKCEGEKGSFKATLPNLNLGSTYSVRAYSKSEGGTSYSKDTKEFTLSGAISTVTIEKSSDYNLSDKTAILHGKVDDAGSPPAYEKGFVYSSKNHEPSLEDKESVKITVEEKSGVVTSGTVYSAQAKNLDLQTTYYVRAYAINEVGPGYSKDVETITLEPKDSKVSMVGIPNVDLDAKTALLQGFVDDPGDPPFTEIGFVYSATNTTPTLNDEHVSAKKVDKGPYEATITGLSLETTYYVRAYVTNEVGTNYSENSDNENSELKSFVFNTETTPPKVTMKAVSKKDRENLTALLQGSVDEVGNPAFYEKGFVYSTTIDTPELNGNDSVIQKRVEGKDKGTYEATADGLALNVTYYVRAYAISEGGTVYNEGDVVTFMIEGTTPEVGISACSDRDLSELSIVLNGYVSELGYPVITERGFVYSYDNQEPTVNDTKVVIDDPVAGGSYAVKVGNLVMGKTYYVKAYAANGIETVYSDVITFDTIPVLPTVTMTSAKGDREKLTALLKGSVDEAGDPAFREKGFVYSPTNNLPTLNDESVSVDGNKVGSYSITVEGLELGNTYYVRAYAVNDAGTAYSKAVTFEVKGTSPVVGVSDVSKKNLAARTVVLNGFVTELGYPQISERGFVYSYDNKEPTVDDVKATVEGPVAGGSYSLEVSNLVLEKTYYVKAYALNTDGFFYSDNTVSFSTKTTLPTVSISQPSDVNMEDLTVNVSGSIESAGNPAYTEKGFVYGYENEIPTVENDKKQKVDGTKTGSFSATLSKLTPEKTYYVRAYAKNVKGTAYSEVVSFDCVETLPVVTTEEATNVDVDNTKAVLHGSITEVGNPAYTERGFVLSTEYEQPSIYDQKIVVSGTGSGSFEYRLTDFSKTDKTYVRAFAMNHKGVAYGETVVLFDPDFVDKGDYIILRTSGIAVQKEDVGEGEGTYLDLSNLCSNSSVGQYTDWRIPTFQELAVLYNNKRRIGGFKWRKSSNSYYKYWSSTIHVENTTKYGGTWLYVIDFNNGESNAYRTSNSAAAARCVRTLE